MFSNYCCYNFFVVLSMGKCGSSDQEPYEPILDNLPPLPIYELLNLLVHGYIHQEKELLVPDSILNLCCQFYGTYGKRSKLNHDLKELRHLENELEYLNSARDPIDASKEIKKFIDRNGIDPIVQYDNPFGPNHNRSVGCVIL